jgi:predicted RNA binding protein YcfA (HicA-like mRNA interferase family)
MDEIELSQKSIVARLLAEGWTVRHGGRHDIYKHPDQPGRIVVPRHRKGGRVAISRPAVLIRPESLKAKPEIVAESRRIEWLSRTAQQSRKLYPLRGMSS